MQEDKALVVAPKRSAGIVEIEMPRMIAEHGAAAKYSWEEFFSGRIRNPHTRKAYLQAVRTFLSWVELQQMSIENVTPGMIGRYFDDHRGSAPTKKLHMSAIRGFLDVLVLRHVIILNPALSVKTEKHSSNEGKTPEITIEQVRRLIASIKLTTAVDYRDRAIICVLVFTAARAGAVAKLKLKDLVDEGTQWSLRFHEKNGKHRSIPVRHDLQKIILDYCKAAQLDMTSKGSPLFKTASGRTGSLSNRQISAIDVCRMVKRRLKAAQLPVICSPHSFRSCTATDLLLQGVPLEDVQYLLGHSDSRVTRLYDRRQKKVTRNIVERISVGI